ncbi:hypothetical protein BDZ90DRAFT_260905 [Jaminaea rosea]|uniref:Uncharacterized protein n=1 Tax=Jaminaea rosea TaxID=1569628 RepID=A0A316UPN1_9BASI|nr:hypothetical protein BDZ90DRAFT_260905 [Jaminaea rosea]PWN27249.1 hypothetical protein BDZ90DRAFT_260905 [Jaminaea rosea]
MIDSSADVVEGCGVEMDDLVTKMSNHRLIASLPLRTGSDTSSVAPSSPSPSQSPRFVPSASTSSSSWSTSPDASQAQAHAGETATSRPASVKASTKEYSHPHSHTNLVAAAAALVLPYWPRTPSSQELALFRLSGVGPQAILDHLERQGQTCSRNAATTAAARRTTTTYSRGAKGTRRATSPRATNMYAMRDSVDNGGGGADGAGDDDWPTASTSKKRKNSIDGEMNRARDFEAYSDAASGCGESEAGMSGSVLDGDEDEEAGDDEQVERPDVSSRSFRASRIVDEIASGHSPHHAHRHGGCGCSSSSSADVLWPSSAPRSSSISLLEEPWSTRWRSSLSQRVRSRIAYQRAAGPPSPPPPLPASTSTSTKAANGASTPAATPGTTTTTTNSKPKVSKAEKRALALKGKGGTNSTRMTLAQLKAQRSGITSSSSSNTVATTTTGKPPSTASPSPASVRRKATPPTSPFTFTFPTPLSGLLAEARERLAALLTRPVADVVRALDLPRPLFDEEGEGDGEGESDHDLHRRDLEDEQGRKAQGQGQAEGQAKTTAAATALREAYFSIPEAKAPMLYPWADSERRAKWSPAKRPSSIGTARTAMTTRTTRGAGTVEESWPEFAQGWALPWRDGSALPTASTRAPLPNSSPLPGPGHSSGSHSSSSSAAPGTTNSISPNSSPTPALPAVSQPKSPKLTRKQKARMNNVHHPFNAHRWLPSAAPALSHSHQDTLNTTSSSSSSSSLPGNLQGAKASRGGFISPLEELEEGFCVYCDYVALYGERPRFWPGGVCRHLCGVEGFAGRGRKGGRARGRRNKVEGG